MRKAFYLMFLMTLALLTACGTSNSNETISKEQFQQLQETLQAQATQLALLMSTPTAPASQPTPTPTPNVVQPTASQPAATSCPTTAEVKNLTGVDVQRLGTEKCAWVWRAVDQATTTAICPSGWVCTWDVVGDIVVVHLGVTQTATIRAGTWRFIDGYPATDAVHNVCELYRNERDFGLSEVPPFRVRFQAAYDGSGALVGPATCP